VPNAPESFMGRLQHPPHVPASGDAYVPSGRDGYPSALRMPLPAGAAGAARDHSVRTARSATRSAVRHRRSPSGARRDTACARPRRWHADDGRRLSGGPPCTSGRTRSAGCRREGSPSTSTRRSWHPHMPQSAWRAVGPPPGGNQSSNSKLRSSASATICRRRPASAITAATRAASSSSAGRSDP